MTGAQRAEGEFQTALGGLEGVEGWLSDDQARRLWDRARELPAGASIVEIGSFRGRSTIVLARAAPPSAIVTAIDPHGGGDRGPGEIRANSELGNRDNAAFVANLKRAGVADRVRHIRMYSHEALESVSGRIDLLYVDGAHRYRPARADIANWGDRVKDGGVMLIHDGFSSLGVTMATLRLLVPSRHFAYTGRTRSLIEYRRHELSGRARTLNALSQLRELGWFGRNLLIKAAIALGVSAAEWPY